MWAGRTPNVDSMGGADSAHCSDPRWCRDLLYRLSRGGAGRCDSPRFGWKWTRVFTHCSGSFLPEGGAGRSAGSWLEHEAACRYLAGGIRKGRRYRHGSGSVYAGPFDRAFYGRPYCDARCCGAPGSRRYPRAPRGRRGKRHPPRSMPSSLSTSVPGRRRSRTAQRPPSSWDTVRFNAPGSMIWTSGRTDCIPASTRT